MPAGCAPPSARARLAFGRGARAAASGDAAAQRLVTYVWGNGDCEQLGLGKLADYTR